jgi:hypothetical protein
MDAAKPDRLLAHSRHCYSFGVILRFGAQAFFFFI